MPKIFYGWWVVAACFLIAFFYTGMVSFGFTAFVEPIAVEFGWSYAQISLAASLRGMEMGIFAPLIGFWVDRFGARRLLLAGTLSIGLGLLLLSRMQSLAVFYTAFVVIGFGTSATSSTVTTPAIADWFKKDIGKALGITNTGVASGGILLPLITVLIVQYNWRTAAAILGAVMLLIGMPLCFVVRSRPAAPGAKQTRPPAGAAPNPGREFDLRSALRTRIFWHLGIAEAIRLMTLMALLTHILPYLHSVGVSRVRATSVAAAIPLLSAGGRLIFGYLADRYDKFRLMALLYFLGGVSVFIFAYVDTQWLLIPFLLLFPLSWGAAPLQGAILRECFGRLSLGSILGIMGALITIARSIGPALAGWSFDIFGRYRPAWLFFAGTFAMAILLMLTVPAHRQEAVPGDSN